jgi:hypothetical protein
VPDAAGCGLADGAVGGAPPDRAAGAEEDVFSGLTYGQGVSLGTFGM